MTKTTKTILWIVVALIVIGGIWYGVGGKSQKEGVIKIGVIGHFSGDYASYGVPMKNAIQLAAEETNAKGGINGREISLVIEDDNSDSNKAATAMNKLVSVNMVDYILSAQGSAMTSVVTPIAQDNRRVLMITLGSAPGLTKEGDYVFRSIVSDSYQAFKINKFINNNFKAEKVAGLYLNDAYGVGIKNIINQNEQVEIVANEMFASGDSDFRTQLLKIKEKNPDVLVLVAHQEYPSILKQIKELNINILVIASETFKDEKILQKSGSTAEGVYTMFMTEPTDYVNFAESYQERFGKEPSGYSKYAYDGVSALIKTIEESDTIKEVKDNLYNLEFNGASGIVSFDGSGDRIGIEYRVYIVKNGQFVPYEE